MDWENFVVRNLRRRASGGLFGVFVNTNYNKIAKEILKNSKYNGRITYNNKLVRNKLYGTMTKQEINRALAIWNTMKKLRPVIIKAPRVRNKA